MKKLKNTIRIIKDGATQYVIIIDNASTDGTNEILKPFIEKKKLFIRIQELILAALVDFNTGSGMLLKITMILFGLWMMIACLKQMH